ncbi:MAG: DNA starvation/stationary phase protection protein [Candidatus Cloacimonadota bacterium]|nr:MAG: DNA starvation/stationary phase protection protein [Candidatus Cloacimonadota bacterium]PIE80173.1 MAG: DNA starvation/stationary phase protection protein [Candidatus Delongbacteria bacterium]
MTLLKEFNEYLADLAVFTFKLHNLHWNIKGEQFIPVHKHTEDLYDQAFEFYDQVAEHIKMNGHDPEVKLENYLKISHIKEIDSKDFKPSEALEIVLEDIKLLRKVATDLRNGSDKEGWFAAVSLFESHVEFFNKEIWFIGATLG